jgi:hypothetical protein
VRVVRITAKNQARYRDAIAALEAEAVYPLGADSFRIDHGADYFAFFRRLGELHYYVAVEDEEVLAVGAGVLRTEPERTWYLCDVKVRSRSRGRHLPLRMLSRVFLPNYLKCRRGYAVSMNSSDGSPNRIVRLMSRFRWAPTSVGTRLALFSLDEPGMRLAAPLVQRHRGAMTYLSLAGKKDIILSSTGRAMPLLHVQFGPAAAAASTCVLSPQAGAVHMFCTPEGDPLHQVLTLAGFQPSASATVIHHRMDRVDWGFILTSDI